MSEKPRRGTWVEITDECNGSDCDGRGECWTPEPARPGGVDTREAELREEIADALAVELESLGIAGEMSCRASEYLADAVLALPAVRAALAAQETVAKVAALLRDAERFPEGHALNRVSADNLRYALRGDR